jgi:hypothetical protein
MTDPRRLADIDRDVADAEAQLRELRAEREQARQERNAIICREFDAGSALGQIATRHRMTQSAVQGVLFRSGRTMKTRLLGRGSATSGRLDGRQEGVSP